MTPDGSTGKVTKRQKKDLTKVKKEEDDETPDEFTKTRKTKRKSSVKKENSDRVSNTKVKREDLNKISAELTKMGKTKKSNSLKKEENDAIPSSSSVRATMRSARLKTKSN
eukprot:14938092-Ditylum_brightwellii.AAC.1